MNKFLCLLVISACSSAATPAPENGSSAQEAPPTLYDALTAEAGAEPVLLVSTDSGIVARTPQRVLRTIVEGSIDQSRYDYAGDMLFIMRAGTLAVVDVREPAPEPIALVGGIPAELPINLRTAKRGLFDNTGQEAQYLAIVWSAEPKLGIEYNIEDLADEELVAAAKQATLVGREWLVANHDRTLRATAVPKARPAEQVGDLEELGCEDEEMCGTAQHFGTTGWQLFVSTYECGDFCHWSCLLLDPATDKVANPDQAGSPAWQALDDDDAMEAQGSCGPFQFNREQTMFATGDELCTIGAGCSKMGGRILGFLAPGPTISL